MKDLSGKPLAAGAMVASCPQKLWTTLWMTIEQAR